jgi:hypothetical protein
MVSLTLTQWSDIEGRYRAATPAKVLAAEYRISIHTIFLRASVERSRANARSARPTVIDRLECLAARLEKLIDRTTARRQCTASHLGICHE